MRLLPSVALWTPNASTAIVTPITALVTPNAPPPIVTPIVAPIVTPLVALVATMVDTITRRAILCSCTTRYVCSCAFNRKNARHVNRSYVFERVVKKRTPTSALMLKRLNPDLAEPNLLARVNAKKPCCNGMCLKMLWKGTRQPLADVELNSPSYYHSGFGVKFLAAVMIARALI